MADCSIEQILANIHDVNGDGRLQSSEMLQGGIELLETEARMLIVEGKGVPDSSYIARFSKSLGAIREMVQEKIERDTAAHRYPNGMEALSQDDLKYLQVVARNMHGKVIEIGMNADWLDRAEEKVHLAVDGMALKKQVDRETRKCDGPRR